MYILASVNNVLKPEINQNSKEMVQTYQNFN